MFQQLHTMTADTRLCPRNAEAVAFMSNWVERVLTRLLKCEKRRLQSVAQMNNGGKALHHGRIERPIVPCLRTPPESLIKRYPELTGRLLLLTADWKVYVVPFGTTGNFRYLRIGQPIWSRG